MNDLHIICPGLKACAVCGKLRAASFCVYTIDGWIDFHCLSDKVHVRSYGEADITDAVYRYNMRYHVEY